MKTTVIRTITRESPLYPDRMEPLPGMPRALYIIGELPDRDVPSVAVVGARMCSGYGRDTAYSIGSFLGRYGISVISGMAVGIDGYAQTGALDAGGKSYAVLASGPDVCYPVTNADLYDRIRMHGGIISEHPEGTKPLGPYFPSRNRIISALSDIVVIVEAKNRSGSLITADFALDQGKSIFAVPGRICDDLSFGCNRLIATGASVLTSPEALLFELDRLAAVRKSPKARRAPLPDTGLRAESKEKAPLSLSKGARKALGLIADFDEITSDDLAELMNLPVSTASGLLMELSVEGLAEETGRGRFRKAKASRNRGSG